MKIFFLYLFVTTTLLFCSCQRQEKPETDFFQDFTLGEIVEKMNVPELKSKSGSGGASTSNGEITERRNGFYLEFYVEEKESKRFDETGFFNELKSEVERKIRESGIRLNGGGESGESFYFNYSKDKNRGWIEVIGTRYKNNEYKLWGVIRETSSLKNAD